MRRNEGPKRRAERYARRVLPGQADIVNSALRKLLVAAYLKGYASCARARRARSVTPITPGK